MKFRGYSPEALGFFKKIAKNNNKIWFEKNKLSYLSFVMEPSRLLVEDLNESKVFQKNELRCLEKTPLFRLNRDVRFSSDKSPYKNHNGIVLSRSGKRKENGVFYFHLEPKESFFAMGFWQPDSRLLTRFRLWVVENPMNAKKLMKELKKHSLVFHQEDSLKRAPRGYEHISDNELMDLLKMKHWIVSQNLKDKDLESPKLIKVAEQFCEKAGVLLKALNPIYDRYRIENPESVDA